MKFLYERRERLLPWVTDWTDPQDKLRNANTNDLTYDQWFWCHPTAFQLLNYGAHIISIAFFLFSFVLSLFLGYEGAAIFCVVFIIINVVMLWKKWRQYRLVPEMTFYDTQLRDYTLEDLEEEEDANVKRKSV